MTEAKYKVGDLVRLVEEPWHQHAGDVVKITAANWTGDGWQYDFVIPEARGGTPEHLIERTILPSR